MAAKPAPQAPEIAPDAEKPPSRWDWLPPPARAKPGPKSWEPTWRERLEAAIAFGSGATQETLAVYFGRPATTIRRHFKEEFEMAGEFSKLALRQRLWHKAMVEGDTAALIFLSKNMLGMSDRRDVNHTGEIPVAREELSIRVEYVFPSDPRANPGPPVHLLEARPIKKANG